MSDDSKNEKPKKLSGIYFDADGNVVAEDSPDVATGEEVLLYPDGTKVRVYVGK